MDKAFIFSQVKSSVRPGRFFAFLVLVLFMCSLFVIMTERVFATEGGGGAYPNGAEDFMAGAVPPPGTYFINYFQFYSAGDFKDNNKHNAIRGFDLKIAANVFRFLHVTNYKILGGFWGAHVFIPLMNVHTETDTPLGNDSKAGLGDIIIDPFILSWHSKNWHFATGLDIYIPTGRFSEDDLANTSRHYWTFEPIFAFTYLSDGGFEVSSKFMYDINTKNNDTDYTSGQEFHFDYTIGKKFRDISVGLGGYFYKQITNDKLKDDKVGSDGFKGQVFAFGPQLKYDYKNLMFTLKYQREIEAKNKPQGGKFWFKFVYAF